MEQNWKEKVNSSMAELDKFESELEGFQDYDEVMAMEVPKHFKPQKPALFWRVLTKVISQPALLSVHFKHKEIGKEKLGKDEPALILMNHSSFIDLKIVYRILYPRPFGIVCTSDGFVGKNWLMR